MDSNFETARLDQRTRAKRYSVVLLLFGIAALVCACPLAFAQQPRGHNSSASGSSPAAAEALQAQVLEATRKTAEMSIDQTRKTAEMAIDQTRNMAEQAIKAAQGSNETIKTIFGWSALIVGALVGLGAFIGFREIQVIREGYKSKVSEELGRFQTALTEVLQKANDDAAAKIHQVTLMSIDIAGVIGDMSRLRAATDTAAKEALSEILLVSLATIDKRAQEVKDPRTRGWVMSQRALACYYVGAFEDAFAWQEQGCQPELNPMNWPDRHQNLACYAFKVYEANPRRVEMRERSREILRELCSRGDAKLAQDLLDDPDLKRLLAADTELTNMLRALIPAAPAFNAPS